mgnify:CR=1 FL=1
MIYWDNHTVGAEECDGCWTGQTEECDCGGRIHNDYEDENWDSVILEYECDRSGISAAECGR